MQLGKKESLIDLRMLTEEVAEYLDRRRDAGYVVICGKNGSGTICAFPIWVISRKILFWRKLGWTGNQIRF